MFITPSFKKSLIVEQFQGNYLNHYLFTLVLKSPDGEWPITYTFTFTFTSHRIIIKVWRSPIFYIQSQTGQNIFKPALWIQKKNR